MTEYVLDIEASSQIATEARLRLWGLLNIETGEIITGANVDDLHYYIQRATFLIGHNIKGYDIPVLQRHGITIPNHVGIIDTWEILAPRPLSDNDPPGKGRADIIGELRVNGLEDNRLPNLKLGTVVRHLAKVFKGRYNFENQKGEFDYTKLRGTLTPKDFKELTEYLESDLLATRDLYLFLDDYFSGFKDFLPEISVQKKHHITASTASIAYKSICYRLGLQEDYGEKGDTFTGATVFEPAGEAFHGRGVCTDFTSQHPQHIIGANLATPATAKEIKEGKYYSGDGRIFKLKGKYSLKGRGKIEQLLFEWFNLRKKYKKTKDQREYTVKIIINSVYGLLSSPVFKSVYYEHTGEDTTRMSTQSSAFMSNHMIKNGYNVLYSDTDSLYIIDPFEDKAKLLVTLENGINEIKKVLPFVTKDYGMGIDDEFTSIFFFKNPNFDERRKEQAGNWRYLKKAYMYITPDNKLKIKGTALVKRDTTRLTKIVFKKYLMPSILENRSTQFEKDFIRRAIETEIRNDITLVGRTFHLKRADFYKMHNQLQAQLSRAYGEGVHTVVKNYVRGVGQGAKYCLASEAKELPIRALDLSKTWSELSIFIKQTTHQQKLASWL